MKLPKLTFLLPYAVLTVVGACFFAASRIAVTVRDELRVSVILYAFLAGFAAVAASAALAARSHASLRKSIRLAFAPTLLFVAGFGTFILVERDVTRIAVAAVTMGLLVAYFLSAEGMGGLMPRYGDQDLAHLSFALLVVASFFGLGFLFSLPSISDIHPAVALFAAASLIGLVTHETLWHEGFAHDRIRPVALAFAVLGAECFVALSFLPVLPFVNAAFSLSLLVPALTTSILTMRGAKAPKLPLAIAAAAAMLVLFSARWN